MCKKQSKSISWICFWWRAIWYPEYSPKVRRISGSLSAFEKVLDRKDRQETGMLKPWVINAKELIEKSRAELKMGKLDEAWKCFHEAKRLEIYDCSTSELIVHARILREESVKLKEWRRKAVLSLVGNEDSSFGTCLTSEQVYRAMLIRDEHYSNQYHKNNLIRGQLRLLLLLLIVFLMFVFIYFHRNFPFRSTLIREDSLSHCSCIWGVLWFGLLGATSSAVLYVRKSYKGTRIPEIVSNVYITLSRIVIGAAFAVMIYILLKTNLAAELKIFSFEISQPFDYFALAFSSGFTERFALSAIQKIADKE
ncbi:MAG: hypothetical protein ACEPOZ_10930 [Marinifilaceae bacterium]